jgi:hypothetical protein
VIGLRSRIVLGYRPWFVSTTLALVLIVAVTLIAHDHNTSYNVPMRLAPAEPVVVHTVGTGPAR